MADAVFEAVGRDDVRFEGVALGREGKDAGDAVVFEDERGGGNHEFAGGEDAGDILEVGGEEIVDGLVGGAEVVGEEAGFFLEVGEEGFSDLEERVVCRVADDGESAGGELEVYVLDGAAIRLGVRRAISVKSEGLFEVHAATFKSGICAKQRWNCERCGMGVGRLSLAHISPKRSAAFGSNLRGE